MYGLIGRMTYLMKPREQCEMAGHSSLDSVTA
jgi:hypothetical protein